jgi:hypothetical protein
MTRQKGGHTGTQVVLQDRDGMRCVTLDDDDDDSGDDGDDDGDVGDGVSMF